MALRGRRRFSPSHRRHRAATTPAVSRERRAMWNYHAMGLSSRGIRFSSFERLRRGGARSMDLERLEAADYRHRLARDRSQTRRPRAGTISCCSMTNMVHNVVRLEEARGRKCEVRACVIHSRAGAAEKDGP